MSKVNWIGVRPERKAPLEVVEQVDVNAYGLVGDHYSKEFGKRNVTAIRQEVIQEIWGEMGLEGDPDPGEMRRNLVIADLPTEIASGSKIKIGEDVILVVTGDCRPCTRMDQNLGDGGLSKMSGKGGYTLQVEKGGQIALGDEVEVMALEV